MARPIPDPDDNPGSGSPGSPGYTPPTVAGTQLALVVNGLNIAITEGQIRDAGGPWEHFKVRVTPMNNVGSGTYAEVDVVVDTPDDDIIEDDT